MPAADVIFNYSYDPAKSDKDYVRFLIGDTDPKDPMFDDREIEFQLTQTPSVKLSAYSLLRIKATEYARKADITVGDVSKSYSKLSDQMFKAADELKCDIDALSKPFFGGLSKSGKIKLNQDSDATQPEFFKGMTDNKRSIQLNRPITTQSTFGKYNGEI